MTRGPQERLAHALDAAVRDPELAELACHASVGLGFAGDGWSRTMTVVDGVVRSPDDAVSPDVEIRMSDGDWSAVLADDPEPRRQCVPPFVSSGAAVVTGDEQAFAQHMQLVRRVVELARTPREGPPAPRRPLSMTGRYVRVDVASLGACDVYVERAGRGQPVLCFATAGSDSRQYHGLVTDTDLTDDVELIAFDLPWHGKSDPPWGTRPGSYSLDSARYVALVARLLDALDLDRPPVLLGPSMAGGAVIEVLAHHPDLVHGAVSCQAASRVTGRRTRWLRDATVNQTLHVPEWTYGLMSPHSPREHRQRVWWGYSQGGFGVYDADLGYYTGSWDVDHVLPLLGPTSPPVVVMSGVYDYSVPPETSRTLAEALPRADFREMPELGHFPHAENPPVFARHLRWALERIEQLGAEAAR